MRIKKHLQRSMHLYICNHVYISMIYISQICLSLSYIYIYNIHIYIYIYIDIHVVFYHDLYQASFSTSGGAAGASIVSHVAAGSASAPRPRTGMGGGRSAPSTTSYNCTGPYTSATKRGKGKSIMYR